MATESFIYIFLRQTQRRRDTCINDSNQGCTRLRNRRPRDVAEVRPTCATPKKTRSCTDTTDVVRDKTKGPKMTAVIFQTGPQRASNNLYRHGTTPCKMFAPILINQEHQKRYLPIRAELAHGRAQIGTTTWDPRPECKEQRPHAFSAHADAGFGRRCATQDQPHRLGQR